MSTSSSCNVPRPRWFSARRDLNPNIGTGSQNSSARSYKRVSIWKHKQIKYLRFRRLRDFCDPTIQTFTVHTRSNITMFSWTCRKRRSCDADFVVLVYIYTFSQTYNLRLSVVLHINDGDLISRCTRNKVVLV